MGGRVLSLALLLSLPHAADLQSAPEPWVDIISPEPAQLFVEGEFSSLALRFRVHGLELGDGKGVAHVYVIRHAMSYGGDAFRGREWHRAAPDARVREAEASIPLDHLELGLGLHQVRVHLVEEAQGQEREVAESAVFFEIRLPALPPEDPIWGAPRPVPDEVASNAFDDKVWLPAEGGPGGDVPAEAVEETVERVWREYVQLHAHMMRPSTPAHDRRLLILDQTAGGLGNRLGSVISGLLLAMLSGRALLVHWDLCDYLINGDESSGGIRWQFPSLDHIRAELGPEAVQGVEYVDMGELVPFLTCQRYTVSTEASGSEDDSSPSDLAVVGTLKIKNPHYYVPLVVSNPYYRRRIFDTLGARPTHELMKKLFTLAPYLQAKVDEGRRQFVAMGGPMIGLQIRQARWCGKLTLADDAGGRTRTNAYMTAEHHELFYACAKTLLRESRGQAGFYLATDMPQQVRREAEGKLGKRRLVYAELPDDNVHDSRAAMEEGRSTDFDGAFLDIWLLASCDDIITTPASSFGYMATALGGLAPITVTKWGKCLRPMTSEPMSHAWPLIQQQACFDERMLVPEYDMMCQDCVVLSCACGDLTCASHSEPHHPLFPRQVAQVPG